MKELCPNKRSDPIPYSATVQECLDKDDSDVGLAKIKDGGKISFIAKGSSLEIVNLQNGSRNASFSFDKETSNWRVSCFCQYQGKYLITLVDHSPNQPKGLLCVYDPGVSRIIKAIQLPYKPTSICLLKEYGGAGDKHNFISVLFKSMFGIAAVGTYAGHLYLIDLRGDDKQEFFPLSNPSSLLSVELKKISRISEFRESAFNNGKHCCVDLNYEFCSYQGFRYVNPSNRLSKIFKTENSAVTALEFIPQTLTLAVGYEFGCYQLWSMQHLNMLFCTVFGNDVSAAVTHFVFQEPDDDPRSCCYLWVGRAALCTNNNVYMGPTTLSLYQILYEEKESRPGYGIIYKDYECVIKRFAHQLTADAYHLVDSQSPGSRIVTFKALGSSPTLCYVVWETCVNDDLTCHLGIFDLNRWYQKQLPGSLRDAMYGRMEAVCPFFAFYSLTDIAEELLPSSILDVHIYEDSINTFQNVVGPQSEQFYWPSSSTFSLRCVSEASSVELDMLGIQRQIIAHSRKQGTESFVDAQSIVQNCWIAGLLQNTADIVRSSEDKRNTDTLLSIHLEHDGINFITTCIKKWAHGSITHAGHSLKLIYDWAWNHVIHVKKNLDSLYINLFDTLSCHMESEHKNTLKKIVMDLKQLVEIFRELQRADALTTQAGVQELKTREKITNYLHLYCNILLILVDVGLLPEPSSNIDTTKELPYPYDILSNYYEEQRKELTHSSKNMSSVEGNSLFIDLISKDFTQDRSSGTFDDDKPTMAEYPPQTIETMCQIFVENCRDDEQQVVLFYYWMLDVCECYDVLQKVKVSKEFKDCLQLPADKSLLVESLWLIDHRLYKDAVEHLALVESKISSYYYTHIVRRLYHAKELHLLTTFCSCKEPMDFCTYDELKLLIKVFLKLKLLDNAYKLQAKFNSKSKKALLFAYFVEQCKLNKVLGKLVTLAFTPEEEELLRRILKNSKDIQDYLLVFYLERGLYHEASSMTKDMRSSGKWQNLRSNLLQSNEDRRLSKRTVLDGFDTKGLLVDGFIQTVPSIEQKKLNLFETRSPNTSLRNNEHQPLSTVYRTASKRTRNDAHASDILSTLQYHDISASSDSTGGLLNCSGFNIDCLGTSSQRRRKSPLFDGEILTSPKKKAKETPVAPALLPSTPTRVQEKLRFAKELTSRQRKDLYQGVDAFLLLNTPPAVRRMKNVANISTTIDPLKTPQSILKSRTKSKMQKIDFAVNTQQIDTSLTTESDKTPFRKIRFTGLSPTSPLTPNEVSVSSHDDLMSHMKSIDSSTHEDQILSELSREFEEDEVTDDQDMIEAVDDGDDDDDLNKTPMESILLELSQDDDDLDNSMEESSPITSSTSIVREAILLQQASPHPSSRTDIESLNTAHPSNDVVSSLFEAREMSQSRDDSTSLVLVKEQTPSPISMDQESGSHSPVLLKERTPSPRVTFEDHSHSPVTFKQPPEIPHHLNTPSDKTGDEENTANDESFDDFQSPLQYLEHEKRDLSPTETKKNISVVMLDDSSDEETNEGEGIGNECEEPESEEEESEYLDDEEDEEEFSENEDLKGEEIEDSGELVEEELEDSGELVDEEIEDSGDIIDEEDLSDDSNEEEDLPDDFVLAQDDAEVDESNDIQTVDGKGQDDKNAESDFVQPPLSTVDDDQQVTSNEDIEMINDDTEVEQSVVVLQESPQRVDEDVSGVEVDRSIYEDAPDQSLRNETSNLSVNQTNASSLYEDVESENMEGDSPLRGREEIDIYEDVMIDEDVKLYADLDIDQQNENHEEGQQTYIFNTDIEGEDLIYEPTSQQKDEDFAIVDNVDDDLPRQTESAEYEMIQETDGHVGSDIESRVDSHQVIAISSEESLITEDQMMSDIDVTLDPEPTNGTTTEPAVEDKDVSPKESFEMVQSLPSVQSIEEEPVKEDDQGTTTPSRSEENMNKAPLLFERLLTENYSNDSSYTDVSESVSIFSVSDSNSPEHFSEKNVTSAIMETREAKDADEPAAMETDNGSVTETDANENLDVSMATSVRGKRQRQLKTPVRVQPPRRITTRSASKKKTDDTKLEESILNEIQEETEQYNALENVNRALVVEVPTTRRSASRKNLEASVPLESLATELTSEISEDVPMATTSKRKASKKKTEAKTLTEETKSTNEISDSVSKSPARRSSRKRTEAKRSPSEPDASESTGEFAELVSKTPTRRSSKKNIETNDVTSDVKTTEPVSEVAEPTLKRKSSKKKTQIDSMDLESTETTYEDVLMASKKRTSRKKSESVEVEPMHSESTGEITEDALTTSTRRSSRRKTIQASTEQLIEVETSKPTTRTTPLKKIATSTTAKTTPKRSPSRRSVNASASEPMLVISPITEENTEETIARSRPRRTPSKKTTTKSTPKRSPSRRGVTATVSEPALCIPPILEEVNASDEEIGFKHQEEETLTKVIARAEESILEESFSSSRTTRRRSTGRTKVGASKSAETLTTSSSTVIKTTKSTRGKPPKASVSHESVLSFVKQSSSSEIEESDSSTRISKRSSSKRASLAITGLSKTRTRK